MAILGAADDALRLLAKLPKNSPIRGIINRASGLPDQPFVTSRLSKPSELGSEMSQFIQTVAENPRTLTRADFPKSARDLGLSPVEGFVYGAPNQKVRQLSDTGMRQLEDNIEAIMEASVDNRVGDPNFYHDINRLLGVSAPDVDRTIAAFTFAPFSAGTAVRENARRWQRFMENPELFPGRVSPEGGTTAGGAWQDAIRILGKETPTPADLSTSGKIVKVGSFGENLAFPESSLRATMDRHAVKNALGIYMPDVFSPDLGDVETYRLFEKAFQNVAARKNMAPHEVQSAAWDTWRRITQSNPGEGMIAPSEFVPLQVSEMFSLAPAARREALQSILGDVVGKDQKFLKRAGLL
jgi:hypothetical protein